MPNTVVRQLKGTVIVSGIASILLGILFLSEPLLAGLSFCYFTGGLLVATGIAKMFFCIPNAEGPAPSVLDGVILFLFGLLCFSMPNVIANIITVMSGIYIIADGANTFSKGMYAIRAKISGGILLVIFAVIFMICGFVVMFAPFAFIMVISGVSLVCEGIFNLVLAATMGKKLEELEKTA